MCFVFEHRRERLFSIYRGAIRIVRNFFLLVYAQFQKKNLVAQPARSPYHNIRAPLLPSFFLLEKIQRNSVDYFHKILLFFNLWLFSMFFITTKTSDKLDCIKNEGRAIFIKILFAQKFHFWANEKNEEYESW